MAEAKNLCLYPSFAGYKLWNKKQNYEFGIFNLWQLWNWCAVLDKGQMMLNATSFADTKDEAVESILE